MRPGSSFFIRHSSFDIQAPRRARPALCLPPRTRPSPSRGLGGCARRCCRSEANEECRMKNEELRMRPALHSSFDILHSTFKLLVALVLLTTCTPPIPPPPPTPTTALPPAPRHR